LDDISFFLFGIKKLNPNRLVLASNGVQLEADHDKPKKTMGSNLHKNFFQSENTKVRKLMEEKKRASFVNIELLCRQGKYGMIHSGHSTAQS